MSIITVLVVMVATLSPIAPSADDDWVMGDIGRVATALGVEPATDGKYDISEILCEMLARQDIDCSTSCFIELQNQVEALPGHCATLMIKTVPGSECAIRVALPSGNESSATGLQPVTANADGYAMWSWVVSGNTRPGQGTIAITAVTPTGDGCAAEFDWAVLQK